MVLHLKDKAASKNQLGFESKLQKIFSQRSLWNEFLKNIPLSSIVFLRSIFPFFNIGTSKLFCHYC